MSTVELEQVSRWFGNVVAVNDVTARDLQKRDGQWTRAKGFDTFAPIGPCIAVGLEPSALDGLAKDGFKSVINLRLATEANANIDLNAAHAKSLGMNYIHIPFNAAQPDNKVVDQFLAAVSNKANQPAYLHCGSASRVGAATRREISSTARTT